MKQKSDDKLIRILLFLLGLAIFGWSWVVIYVLIKLVIKLMNK